MNQIKNSISQFPHFNEANNGGAASEEETNPIQEKTRTPLLLLFLIVLLLLLLCCSFTCNAEKEIADQGGMTMEEILMKLNKKRASPSTEEAVARWFSRDCSLLMPPALTSKSRYRNSQAPNFPPQSLL